MVILSLKLVPYARRYRRDLLDLINDPGCLLHIHLDWHTVEEWIGQPDTPILLAWAGPTLVGAMAGSPSQEDCAWLRLIAVRGDVDTDGVLRELWAALRDGMIAGDIRQVGVLMLQSWLERPLDRLGFSYVEHIVTLRRSGPDVPAPLRKDIVVRHTDWHEADKAVVVDNAAFGPMWQLGLPALRQAARHAASFTLAELDGRPVGYQLTTLHGYNSIHLARLAVLPAVQGGGVGGVLLSEMLNGFVRRNILTCSVNTQASNTQSQRLYRRYGFEFTGYDMPYWKIELG